MVPMPGFWSKNVHKDNAKMLTKKVTTPIEKPTFKEIPWARTLHGEAPVYETIKRPSPKPKIPNPIHKYTKVENLGLKFSGFFELHLTLGIFFIDKNIFTEVYLLLILTYS